MAKHNTFGRRYIRMILSITVITTGSWNVRCTSSVCIEKARNNSVPVVGFCTQMSATGNPVVIDGFVADRTDVTKCVCVAEIESSQISHIIKYENAYDISPIQNKRNCGSTVFFSEDGRNQNSKTCEISGNINIRSKIFLIGLQKYKQPWNTKYCFKMKSDNNTLLNISCNKSDVMESTTVKHVRTTATPNMQLESSTLTTNTLLDGNTDLIETTEQTQTTQHDAKERDNTSDFYGGMQRIDSDESQLMYIAIGCGAFGGIMLLTVVICIFKASRKKKRTSRNSNAPNAFNEDDNEHELQYNTLYVSSTDDAVQQTEYRNRTTNSSLNINNVAYQVKGNSSEIDVYEMSHTESQTDHISATATTGELDISFIKLDLIEKQKSFAQNKNDKDTQGSMASSKLRNENSVACVKHIISQGENGCEYAVVEKENGGKNDVYAVVNKKKKGSF